MDNQASNAEAPHSDATFFTGVARELAEKISSKQAIISIAGLGYVGLPLAVEFAGRGFRTIGIDLDPERVHQVAAGDPSIEGTSVDVLRRVIREGMLEVCTDFSRAGEADVVFICVPTPVTTAKNPEMRHIESAAGALAEHLRKGQLIVLKSTTYPGTTEELVQPLLEQQGKGAGVADGFVAGRDYFLAFSPERIDPGNRQFATANTPVVVGGVTRTCTQLAVLAMKQVCEQVHPVSSPRVAEMEKLLENIFRSVNIALLNELAQLCDRMGDISVWEVVEAAATKPFGFMPFFPGPGLGGHCIPVDPYYLSWLARRHDFETAFITLSARINETMPHYVVEAVMRAVAKQPVQLSDARVLVLGVAFKRNVSDTRHSPALRIMELLSRRGVTHLAYSDPHVPELDAPDAGLRLASVALTEETLRSFDVVVIVTDHSAFPYADIAEHTRCIVDTRNALKNIVCDREKIMLLGGGDF